MTQENKELLFQDLCTRLPYGVKVHAKVIDTDTNTEIEKVGELSMMDTDTVVAFTSDDTNCYIYVTIHEVKPYLFPLSSMTEEQTHEFYCRFIANDIPFEDFVADYWNTNSFHKLLTSIDDCGRVIGWFNENHCDYRGLIPMGLAIDATNLNIY